MGIMTRLRLSLLLSATALSLASCKFRVPSPEEQDELLKRKTFPGGAPGWFSPTTANSGVPQQPSGYISNSLRGPAAIAPRVDEVEIPKQLRDEEYRRIKAQQATQSVELKSPLDRIAKSCPSIEQDVNAAITTTDRNERVAKYETLTARCPSSPDLFLWLAADYMKAGRSMDARSTYEKVLVLDSSNAEAKNGLDELNKSLTAQPTNSTINPTQPPSE